MSDEWNKMGMPILPVASQMECLDVLARSWSVLYKGCL